VKRLAFVAAVLAFAAYAGQQGKDLSGAPPSPLGPSAQAERQGITLANAVGCRMSVRVDAGEIGQGIKGADGLAQTGLKLQPWYYDPLNGWVEGDSSLQCSVAARPDAGIIRAFVCPDLVPAARFGRIFVSKLGIAARTDAGTGADWITDAGTGVDTPVPGPQPVYRIECWGPSYSSNP
jgi:hypothetical protein